MHFASFTRFARCVNFVIMLNIFSWCQTSILPYFWFCYAIYMCTCMARVQHVCVCIHVHTHNASHAAMYRYIARIGVWRLHNIYLIYVSVRTCINNITLHNNCMLYIRTYCSAVCILMYMMLSCYLHSVRKLCIDRCWSMGGGARRVRDEWCD